MRAFFAGGADKMHLPWAIEALPLLIHVSLFLFFVGLIIFMRGINHSVYLCIISAIGLFSAVYVSFTCMPIFLPNSPYNTPLSLIAYFILAATTQFVLFALSLCSIIAVSIIIVSFIVLVILGICLLSVLFIIVVCLVLLFGSCLQLVCGAPKFRDMVSKFEHLAARELRLILSPRKLFENCPLLYDTLLRMTFCQRWVLGNSPNAAEELASGGSPEIDLDILKWTIGALGDDDTLEKFFEDIPGFFHSPTVKGLNRPLPDMFLSRFYDSWGGFLERSWLSNSVDETVKPVKTRRLEICMKAIKEICGGDRPDTIFWHLYHLRFDQGLPSILAAESLALWCASSNSYISVLARCTVARILPYIRERDDRWIALAQDVSGLPGHVLRDHIAHGDDSVFLVIPIATARQVVRSPHGVPPMWDMLSSISKFDILKTLPGLQDLFCSLWNEIVEEANGRLRHRNYLYALRGIRHLYIALHQGTDSAPIYFDASTPSDDRYLYDLSSYPKCIIPTHHLDPTVPRLPQARLDGPHNPSPLPPPSERQPTPGRSTVPQRAIEAIDIAGRPSSAYYPRLHPQEFPSPSLDTAPEHMTVTLDINRLVIAEVSHFSHQSSPSTAALTANIVRSSDPTTDVPIDEMGQTSQIPAATFHTLLLSDAVPVIVTPSTVHCVTGDFFDTFFTYYPSAYIFSSPRRRYRAAGYSHATIRVCHHPNLVHG